MFNLISKHRNSLMGIAAILIVVHHYLTEVLGFPYKIGAIGVDIFMFTMGFGLFFSLNKKSEKNFFKSLQSFYFRRFKRIFPTLTVFLIAWGMWKHSNGGFTLVDFCYNLSLLGYWTLPYGKYFNWFISGLLLFYFAAPIFYLIVGKTRNNRFSTIITFILISIVIFFLKKDENNEICRSLIMIVRLIPLLFGMFFSSCCNATERKKNKYILILFSLLFLCGATLHILNNIYWNDSGFTYGMPWYGFGLMTPFVSIVIVYIMEFLSKIINFIPKILSFFGNISFELYLTHIFIIEYIIPKLASTNNLWFDEPLNFITAFFTSTLFAYVLSLLTKQIIVKTKN